MASRHEAKGREVAQLGEQKVTRGAGGETIRLRSGDVPVLTTQQGIPVADDQNSLKVGARGPTLLEDFHFREKIFHFDHERIPERVVHARGFGAHGFFENYESLADITRADLFQRAGREDRGLRPLLDRRRQQGLGRPRARRARLRGQALHQGGQLGPRRQQHPGLLHPGRDQVPRPDPRRQAGARPRLPAGADRARQLLGLHLAHAREHAHGACGSCPTGRSRARSASWRASASTPSASSTPRASRPSSSSTGSRSRACSRWSGTRRSRSTAPTPTSTAATSGTRSRPGDFPEWELGLQLFDEAFADEFDFDVLDATKIIPEEEVPVAHRRPAGARPLRRQLLRRDRAGRLLHAEHRAGHRLQQRPAAAGPQLLLPRHPAEAARRPELHPYPDQRAEDARSTTSSRTATWRCATPRAGSTTSRTPGATRAARARSPERGLPSLPGRRGRRQAARSASETLRRPLQPGPAVLHQPDRDRAGPHRATPSPSS